MDAKLALKIKQLENEIELIPLRQQVVAEGSKATLGKLEAKREKLKAALARLKGIADGGDAGDAA